MKAIKTKFIGPSNVKGSRIRASEPDGKSVTISYSHELNGDENHLAAAQALCKRMNWSGLLVTGWLGGCFVHVFTGKDGPITSPSISPEKP